jgi:hypothetical protein
MSVANPNNKEQELLSLMGPFMDTENQHTDLPDCAQTILTFVTGLLASEQNQQLAPEIWHEYLNITGKSEFLSSLGSTRARHQWAEQVFEIVDKSEYSLLKLFQQRVAEHPDRLLFSHADSQFARWSYRQVFDYMKRVAAAFYSANDEPRVLLYLDNCLEGACTDLACLNF